MSSPHTVDGLINDIPYWFRLEVLHADGRKTFSEVIETMTFGGLNDTGVDWCADNLANRQFDGTREEMIRKLSGPLRAISGTGCPFWSGCVGARA